ncbi:hypothetical protein NDR87_13060 [Nocardia sp. CDC159]|uniref:Uncharacterized protein n=1 Tax=Nocardia pulmonis TaxID=2951408 RepID=A0A9X2E5T0_9NOCA|nr:MULTISPECIES: hypothetical protein [Nocardia]MCM6774647.1 hypothetical protein [Nocardia pulmonis]MCM6787288.1 hypothetical protein [Nocardia sp. CDC159]
MSRPRRTRLSLALVGAMGVIFAVGAATASAAPSAALRGGTSIAAHVTGEQAGRVCRIASAGVDMPWRPVGSDGTVDLDTGPVHAGRHLARVVCEDPRVGAASVRTVGRAAEVVTGHWAPAFEFLHHHRLEVLTPRGHAAT